MGSAGRNEPHLAPGPALLGRDRVERNELSELRISSIQHTEHIHSSGIIVDAIEYFISFQSSFIHLSSQGRLIVKRPARLCALCSVCRLTEPPDPDPVLFLSPARGVRLQSHVGLKVKSHELVCTVPDDILRWWRGMVRGSNDRSGSGELGISRVQCETFGTF